MKTKTLLIAILCVGCVMSCAAQKKAKKDKNAAVVETVQEQTVVEEDETPTITEECIVNMSLFQQSAKNKQYADAVEPWYQVYNSCPNANKVIYTRGPEIVGWQIENAATEAEKAQYKETLMGIYDSRIKWFGDDPQYPVAYILGQKGMDYCQYFTEDDLKLPAYEWLKASVEGMGDKSSLNVVNKFAEVSNNLYKSNPEKYGDQYISDYQLATGVLSAIANDPSNKYSGNAKSYKDYIDNVFAVSGAADCNKLDELYGPAVQNSLSDLDMLGKVMKLYRSLGCTESDVYFAAAEASHKLQPTAESAAGCAAMSAKKGNYKDAIAYYDQAFELADNDEDRANYLYNNAVYAFNNLNQYSTARQYARRSLEIFPNQGRCYMLIGLMYASSKPYDDAVLNKTVFWAAVDKFNKAKQVDPTVTEEANKLINSYSKYFPTTEEIFFHSELAKGKTFTVGGWIGETTTCR